MTFLLETRHLTKHYRLPRAGLWQAGAVIKAVTDLDLAIAPGKSLGLVGESGSGKSTLARLILGLEAPDSGSVHFQGVDIHKAEKAVMRKLRRDMQMVFQDPYGSLDPRQTVERIVAEPLAALGKDKNGVAPRDAVIAALNSVGLRDSDLVKYPHEFSGGQRQRIAIARALVTKPKLIVADEPLSALDVSVQAQVLNLMRDLQQNFGITYLFISHDLAVVEHLCDEVAVIQHGTIVERGNPQDLFANPHHAYTRELVNSVPKMDGFGRKSLSSN
ncbi:ATP-binding cassette domain-containing protein [Methylovirgula sp. 4M-Z18]|uniref:ATP-binding cassette domain-containing protein n=1 Tax=Methylovirgula sp. 4M-Z18 TaxID=2293567 RepID=UPI000E2EFBF2|nr:ABC transporter ATP-binding protein [Methylovirgula sp. 4M-Z18]